MNKRQAEKVRAGDVVEVLSTAVEYAVTDIFEDDATGIHFRLANLHSGEYLGMIHYRVCDHIVSIGGGTETQS